MDDDFFSGFFITLILGLALLSLASILMSDDDPTCPEYGTVLVTVDNEHRCVPWEDAPDLQGYPEP